MDRDELLLMAILEAQVVSLTARYNEARNYTLNTTMKIEAQLCLAQIDALKKEQGKLEYNAELRNM